MAARCAIADAVGGLLWAADHACVVEYRALLLLKTLGPETRFPLEAAIV